MNRVQREHIDFLFTELSEETAHDEHHRRHEVWVNRSRVRRNSVGVCWQTAKRGPDGRLPCDGCCYHDRSMKRPSGESYGCHAHPPKPFGNCDPRRWNGKGYDPPERPRDPWPNVGINDDDVYEDGE